MANEPVNPLIVKALGEPWRGPMSGEQAARVSEAFKTGMDPGALRLQMRENLWWPRTGFTPFVVLDTVALATTLAMRREGTMERSRYVLRWLTYAPDAILKGWWHDVERELRQPELDPSHGVRVGLRRDLRDARKAHGPRMRLAVAALEHRLQYASQGGWPQIRDFPEEA